MFLGQKSYSEKRNHSTFASKKIMNTKKIFKKNVNATMILLAIIASVFVCTQVCSQTSLSLQPNEYSQYGGKNIYEIGKPLTSCDCNFENLFANFGPKFLTNHDSIQLISWNFDETMSDTLQINNFARKIFTPPFAMSEVGRRSASTWNVTTQKRDKTNEFWIRYFAPEAPMGMEKEFQLNSIKLQEGFKSLLKVGDKVYSIKLKYNNTEYELHAFCRENRIFYDLSSFMDTRDLSLP